MIQIKEELDLSVKYAGRLKHNKEIFEKYKDKFDNISEFIYYYKNPEKAESERYCKVCGKKNKFVINKYQNYCSRTCMCKDEERRKQIAQSNLKTFAEKGKAIIEQRKATKLKKYGDANFNNPNKRAKTNLEKYGTDNLFKDVARMTQARKEKLGVEHALQRKDLLKKSQDTLESHYGVRATFKSKEILAKKDKTNLERWGTIYPIQNKEIKNKIIKHNIEKWGYKTTALNPIVKAKQIATLKKNYNVDCPFKSEKVQRKIKDICKQKYGNEIFVSSQEFKSKNKEHMLKSYDTKKKNDSFKTSKQEEQVYIELLKKFDKADIIRQYHSKQYPYACDFYIKSLDLYIECNFYISHYYEPFDSNNQEHLKKLEKLKKKAKEINFKGKTKEQYIDIINTWTKKDVAKLKCFKENKLSYKIFYNKEQFDSWFKTI